MLLLDAGVWVSAWDPAESFHDEGRKVVLDFAHPVAALDLTLYEVANVVGAKKGQLKEARHLLQLLVERCGGDLVAADAGLMESALEIAAEHGITAYDAAYVAAA